MAAWACAIGHRALTTPAFRMQRLRAAGTVWQSAGSCTPPGMLACHGVVGRAAAQAALAEDLNGAILAHRGLPAASPLERCYQQAAVALAVSIYATCLDAL